MKLQVMGISGKAGSGKDYVASRIFETLGFKRFSLAWHFKVWAVGTGRATYDEVFVTKPPKIRTLLQEMGTEEGRNVYGENVWCDTAATWIRVLGETWGQHQIIIPDIRFPNEVAMIHQLGGRVIRLHAPIRIANNGMNEQARLHPSETALDGQDYTFDAVVRNDVDEPITLERAFEGLFDRWGWHQLADKLAVRQSFRVGA